MTKTLDLDTLVLKAGKHQTNTQGDMCVMEAVAFIAGEPWSDHPQCASPVIGAFLRTWNDGLNDEDRQMLKPLIPRLVGTKGTAAQERRRSWMALDWYCRVSTPAWLRLAGLTAEADAVAATAPIVDAASARAAQDALNKARSQATAAGDAAGYAAVDAAWAAAWAASGNAAAGAAAWDAAAGNAAAWAAARAAAAGVAARNAAWDATRDALRPTVEELQRSALDLVDRMIAVTAEDNS